MKFFVVFLLLWGLSFSIFAVNLPTRIDISFEVKTGVGHGELHETLRIKKENDVLIYHITSEARASGVFKLVRPGSIVRDSRGIITQQGLEPSRFSDQRGKKIPSVAIFDWENDFLLIQHKNQEKKEALPTGTLDRLSLLYNYFFTPLDGKFVDLHVTDGRYLQRVRYSIEKEMLETPIGELETIVLTKQLEENDKMKRKIWFATNHHMLPVRIVSTEKDGLELEKIVTSINLSYSNDK